MNKNKITFWKVDLHQITCDAIGFAVFPIYLFCFQIDVSLLEVFCLKPGPD